MNAFDFCTLSVLFFVLLAWSFSYEFNFCLPSFAFIITDDYQLVRTGINFSSVSRRQKVFAKHLYSVQFRTVCMLVVFETLQGKTPNGVSSLQE